MLRYLLRRLALAALVIFLTISLSFFMMFLSSDPLVVLMTRAEGASPEEIARLAHELGYDRPVLVQYADYVAGVLQGDFGNSIVYQQPAMDLVAKRIPYTVQLAVVAFLLTLVIAVPLGVLSGLFHGRAWDHGAAVVSGLGLAVPSFVVGPILILVFAVGLGLLPVAGAGSPAHFVLPAITLALLPAARTIRVVRSSVFDVAGEEFVRAARAKGLDRPKVVWRHVLPNAMLPVLSVLGLQLGALLGGAVIVETIFGWPGLGLFAVQSVLAGDFPLVQAIVVISSVIVVLITLGVDLLYMWVDPRIRYT
jgi:peptide/nickel transport system permease protein